MNKFDKLFEEAYAPTDEQKEEIGNLCPEHKDALKQMGIHMYAQGWRDYMIPFVGIGLAAGFIFGFVIGKR